jgi:acyl-CoA thioester hydrolase
MISHIFEKRVRYAETDKMGYLYYGHYAKYYEIGRAELIRELGLSYRILEDEMRIMMPVVQLQCRYRAPAYYDDLLQIKTVIPEMPTKMIRFEHEIRNEEDELLNRGEVKLFFVDRDSGQRVSCPEYLKNALTSYY